MIRSFGKPADWRCYSVIEVKSKFGAEFRRFSLDCCKSNMFKDFHQFTLRLHHLYDAEIFISYADLHGDLLPINNEDNFCKAVSTAQPLLRIFIHLKEEMEQASTSTDWPTRYNKSIMAVYGNVSRGGNIQIGMPHNFRPVSSIIDVDILPGCHRRVRLYHQGSDKPLGFYIRDGITVIVTPYGLEKVPGIFISRIVPGGLAESCGLLAINDQVLEVNGIEVTGKSLDQVTNMMIANSCNLVITVKPANQHNNIRNPVKSLSLRVIPDGKDSVSYPGLPLIMGTYSQMRNSYLNKNDSDVVFKRAKNPWLQCSRAMLSSLYPYTHYECNRLTHSLDFCHSQPCLNLTSCSESSGLLRREINSQQHYQSIASFNHRSFSTHDILSTLSLDLHQHLNVPREAMEEDGSVIIL